MKFLSYCLGVAVIGIGTGCGVKKNLDEMHDSTVKMSKTTEDMNERISNTYLDMRTASARQARGEALADLKKFEDIGPKLGSASEYYAAQEFQFWKPRLETPEARLEFMDIAVQDYFHKVREYIKDRNDAVIPIIQSEEKENLFAMAATLHFINPSQTVALKGTNIPVVTMYSMIADGLRAKKKILAGELREDDLPAYQKQVLIFEQDAVYLLQVRQNFLKAFAYILMANTTVGDQSVEVHSFMDLLKFKNLKNLGKVALTKLFGVDWTPNFAIRTVPQINFDAEVLEYAANTMSLLREVGYVPARDGKLESLYKNIETKSTYQKVEFSAKPADQAYVTAVKRVESAVKVALKNKESSQD